MQAEVTEIMRYRIDPETGLPIAETSPGMLGSTVLLALVIGVVLLIVGRLGRQLWLTVWSIGLIISSIAYLIWHYFKYISSAE